MSDIIRVAIVGLGSVVEEHHAFAIDKLVQDGIIKVVAVADPSIKRVNWLRETWGRKWGAMEWLPNGDTLALQVPIDAAFLFLPPYAHGSVELALLKRGIPFFVEKPLGVDLAGPAAIEAAVKDTGVTVSVGFIERTLPWNKALKFFFDNGGRRGLRAALVQNINPINTLGRWTSYLHKGAGAYIENCIHQLDLIRFWGFEPVRVSCFKIEREPMAGINQPWGYSAQYVLDNGATMTLVDTRTLDKLSAPRREFTLIGDGWLVDRKAGVWGEGRIVKDGQTVAEWKDTPFKDHFYPYYTELKAFVDAVRTGDRGGIEADYPEATKTWRATLAAMESAERGGEVVDVASFDDEKWRGALERSRQSNPY